MSTHSPAPADDVLRPRDLGQILDQTFRVFGRSWRSLLPMGLIGATPGLLYSLFVLSLSPDLQMGPFGNPLVRALAAADAGDFSGGLRLGSLMVVSWVAILLLYPLYKGALLDAATRAVLHMPPVSVGESFRVGATRYGAMLGSHALLVLMWIAAVPLLALAGLLVLAFLTIPVGLIALATFTVFTGHAVVVEQKGAGSAIGRSFELVRSRFWPLLGTGIVFWLLSTLLSYIVVGPSSFAAGIVTAITGSFLPFTLLTLVEGLAATFITPFMAVGLTVVYFDTRVRREGYDLEWMARQQAESATGDFQP